MPLELSDQVALDLRIAAILHLDPLKTLTDVPPQASREDGERMLKDAQDAHEDHKTDFDKIIVSAKRISDRSVLADFLNDEAANYATKLSEDKALTGAADVAKRLEARLRLIAEAVRSGETGDGIATVSSICGVLPIARSVETHVADRYASDTGIDARMISDGSKRPILQYTTVLTNDINKRMRANNVGGQADIKAVPAVVDIHLLRHAKLSITDLWQLAYVLHHELVCHGFQYAGRIAESGINEPCPRPNASAGCSWSEGWMDVVSYWLAIEWARRRHCLECLGSVGPNAIVEMTNIHAERYPNLDAVRAGDQIPAGIGRADALMRLAAAEAFYVLVSEFSLLMPFHEADDTAIRFSLLLNAHRDADPVVLATIVAALKTTLGNEDRPDAARRALGACITFAAAGDLQALQEALAACNLS